MQVSYCCFSLCLPPTQRPLWTAGPPPHYRWRQAKMAVVCSLGWAHAGTMSWMRWAWRLIKWLLSPIWYQIKIYKLIINVFCWCTLNISLLFFVLCQSHPWLLLLPSRQTNWLLRGSLTMTLPKQRRRRKRQRSSENTLTPSPRTGFNLYLKQDSFHFSEVTLQWFWSVIVWLIDW